MKTFWLLVLLAVPACADHLYVQVNLTSDVPGLARRVDPNLDDPWGLTVRESGKIVVANNGTGLASVYRRSGRPRRNAVAVPGEMTGLVPNFGPDFVVVGDDPSRMIYATRDGLIAGWNPNLDKTNAFVAVDRSASGAVYTGVTRGRAGGAEYLYVANFRAGVVEMYDDNFQFVRSFTDPAVPSGYVPFNVRNIRDKLFVTFAKQLAANPATDEPGDGNGYVSVFDLAGNFTTRFASRGPLNSPWGIARAPWWFGIFSDAVLVANSGDGRITAYDPGNGALLGQMRDASGTTIEIAGLRGLTFGAKLVDVLDPFCCCCVAEVELPVLYFTAGPRGNARSLFGYLRPRF